MKNSITLIGLTCVVFGAYFFQTSFVKKSKNIPAKVVSDLAMCASNPQPSIPDAKQFDPTEYVTPAVMVRKNINSYTPTQFASLKAGIDAMKALPITDKTSWQYQAAIHWTTAGALEPSWNSCEHGTDFFLSWHRMYLYFFERILRAKSGDPNLTLPYWNYQLDPALHAEYRNNTGANPLYDGTRYNSINSGGAIPPGISTDIQSSLNKIPFFDFQNDLENPHGDVHVAIGGNMGSVPTAALDPCFWLHHTNIDRLWQVWNNKCGGRTNPTDATWLNQTYTFFDENGTAVNMTGHQILKTASSLNYVYDLQPTLACNIEWKKWKYLKVATWRWPWPFPFKNRVEQISLKKAQLTDEKLLINQMTFRFKGAEANDRVFIEFINPKVNVSPEGVIEVYVNLPKGKNPNHKVKNYAGTLNLFNLRHGTQKRESLPLRVNITEAVRKLKIKPKSLGNLSLTFVVRGNTLQGREVQTKTDFSAESINIVFERPEKN